MQRDVSAGCSPRLVVGIGVMALGVLLTLDNLRLVDSDQILSYWPAALVAIGISKLLTPPLGKSASGWFLLLLGIGLLLDRLDLVEFDSYWPVFLIGIGALIVSRALGGPGRKRETSTDTDTLSVVAMMSGVDRGSGSQDFRGGDITAVMGGCELDLTQAQIASGEAVIDTFAVWGGIEIKVPKDWEVVCRGFALMGAFEDKTSHSGSGGQRLVVKGIAVMGGVEILN